jgi:hypothetical protein
MFTITSGSSEDSDNLPSRNALPAEPVLLRLDHNFELVVTNPDAGGVKHPIASVANHTLVFVDTTNNTRAVVDIGLRELL